MALDAADLAALKGVVDSELPKALEAFFKTRDEQRKAAKRDHWVERLKKTMKEADHRKIFRWIFWTIVLTVMVTWPLAAYLGGNTTNWSPVHVVTGLFQASSANQQSTENGVPPVTEYKPLHKIELKGGK